MIRLACPECDGYGSRRQAIGVWSTTDPRCEACEGSGYLLAPPDFVEVMAAVLVFVFVFAGCWLFAWWVLG